MKGGLFLETCAQSDIHNNTRGTYKMKGFTKFRVNLFLHSKEYCKRNKHLSSAISFKIMYSYIVKKAIHKKKVNIDGEVSIR